METLKRSRTIWPTKEGMLHWNIRRSLSLPNYYSDLNHHAQEEVKSAISAPQVLHSLFQQSCTANMSDRVQFYKNMMNPTEYRRTSEQCSISVNPDHEAKAYVKPEAPDHIFLTSGVINALENEVHKIISEWSDPFGVNLSSSNNSSERNLPDFIEDWHSKWLGENFDSLSSNQNKQIFADNLSQMALIWMIGHEDAHCYLGHTRYFLNTMQIADLKEKIPTVFSESDNMQSSSDYISMRHSAENESDMCSTMRSVDYFFDTEYLKMIAEHLEGHIQQNIYPTPKDENSMLTVDHRVLLMRFIYFSCILPLALFEKEFSHDDTQYSTHPNFLTRCLNIMLTIQTRCIDVSIHNPHYLVGDTKSIINGTIHFFDMALDDLQHICQVLELDIKYDGAFARQIEKLTSTDLKYALLLTFFGYHGQLQTISTNTLFGHSNFPSDRGVVKNLISTRKRMLDHQIKIFSNDRFNANPSRTHHVLSDLEKAQEHLQNLNLYFPIF